MENPLTTNGCEKKFKASGSLEKYTVRLVAKRYSPVEKIEFNEISSPIANF